MRNNHTRCGFGLVDVIVASICLSLLVSLLLPALLQIRNQTRKDECATRLRAIVLASHNFHDAYRRMPPATLGFSKLVDVEKWNTEGDVDFWKNTQNTSSLLLTAPYIGMEDDVDAVHEIAVDVGQSLADYNKSADNKFEWQGQIEGLEDIMSKEVDRFLCPEDDISDQSLNAIIATQTCETFESDEMDSQDHCRDIATQAWPVEEQSLGLTNYIACIGVVGASWVDDPAMKRWQGAMSMRDCVTLERISDGTSRTLAYGESLGEIVDEERKAGMAWIWGGGARITGNLPFDPSKLDEDDKDLPMFGNMKSSSVVGFGSQHDGTVNFGLCDGSVRGLKRDIDRTTLYELAGRQDGGVPMDF